MRYQTLRGDVLSESFPVASDVGPSGVVDVALDAAGSAVAWRDEDSGAHAARRETADGS